MGRHEEALADFTRAIDLNPSHARAIASRAETYRPMGRHEEALADYTRAIDLDPVATRGPLAAAPKRTWRRAARGGAGRFQPGDRPQPCAASPGPSSAAARPTPRRAVTTEALADITRAVDLHPGDAWAIGRRGQVYETMGRLGEALADLSQAIDLNPDLAWAFNSRAQFYEAMGRREEALADLSRATDLTPTSSLEVGGDSPQQAGP